MKNVSVFALILAAALSFAQNQERRFMKLEGYYNGKNVIVKNPFLSGRGFCAQEVMVNGVISTAETNAEFFQIPLDLHKIKMGEFVKIEIGHVYPCGYQVQPSVANPGALLSEENYKAVKENKLVIDTKFNFQNIVFTNPREASGVYGIKKVTINGKPVDLKLDADIIEISPMPLAFIAGRQDGMKNDDPMKIEFVYAKGCDPVFLNPEIFTSFAEKK